MSNATKAQLDEFMCRFRKHGPNAKMHDGDYLLTWALRNKIPELAGALLAQDADPSVVGLHDSTPLILSCTAPYKDIALDIIKKLKKDPQKSKHINAVDEYGRTALSALCFTEEAAHYNAESGRKIEEIVDDIESIFDALIDSDADINIISHSCYNSFPKGTMLLLSCRAACYELGFPKSFTVIAEKLALKCLEAGASLDIGECVSRSLLRVVGGNETLTTAIEEAVSRAEVDLVAKYAAEIEKTPAPVGMG